jgi:hypothetical protein
MGQEQPEFKAIFKKAAGTSVVGTAKITGNSNSRNRR